MAETFDRAAVEARLAEHHCTSVNWRDGVAYTYCPSCGEPGCDLASTLAVLDATTARCAALESAAREAMEHDRWEALHTLLRAPATGEENG